MSFVFVPEMTANITGRCHFHSGKKDSSCTIKYKVVSHDDPNNWTVQILNEPTKTNPCIFVGQNVSTWEYGGNMNTALLTLTRQSSWTIRTPDSKRIMDVENVDFINS